MEEREVRKKREEHPLRSIRGTARVSARDPDNVLMGGRGTRTGESGGNGRGLDYQ